MVVSQPLIAGQPIEMEYDLQKQKTYGLWYDNGQKFVEVDLVTGQLTTVANLPTVSAVAIGNSTFDSNLGRYIFMGIEGGVMKLITLNAITGSIIYSAPLPGNLSAFEYDVTASKLYGLRNDVDSSIFDPFFFGYGKKVMFVEIDLATANSTVVDSTPVNQGVLVGYGVGLLGFDQQTQTYIATLANDTSFNLVMINANSGKVFSTVPMGDVFEFQVDNISFARSFYSLPTNVSSIENQMKGKLYPNPVIDRLNIEVNAQIEAIRIHDLNGRLIQSDQSARSNSISVQSLNKGIYILEAETDKGIFRQKFVK